jgi:hypothetical protein
MNAVTPAGQQRKSMLFTIIISLVFLQTLGCGPIQVQAEVFTNSFLVRMREPSARHIADQVALRNGFVNLGPVSIFILSFDICLKIKNKN